MNEREQVRGEPNGKGEESATQSAAKALRERLRSVRSVTERRTLAGLARELRRMPAP
jgi:hypothetical protein